MNTLTTRRAAAVLATTVAVAATLTTLSAFAPATVASAGRAAPSPSVTHCGASAASEDRIARIEQRKGKMAQWYIDHAAELSVS